MCLLQVSTVSLSATQQPWNQRSTTLPITGEFLENTEGDMQVFITDTDCHFWVLQIGHYSFLEEQMQKFGHIFG